MKLIDLALRRFGRLEVLWRAEDRVTGGRRRAHWKCRCACGRSVVVAGEALRGGLTTSCGCSRKKHGPCRECGRPNYGNGLCRLHWKREWRMENVASERANERMRYAMDGVRTRARHVAWYRRNAKHCRGYARAQTERLTDAYVRGRLRRGLSLTAPLSPVLLEAKRAQLQLHRLTRKKT